MKIAFLGDSITFGYGLADRADRFASVYCKRTGDDEQNLGITGTLVARAGLSRGDGTAFIDRAPQMAGADIAVIFGGTNDYFWSDTPIHGDAPDVRYFADAADALCRIAASQRPASRNLLVTPYPHHGVGNFAGGEHFKQSAEHDTTAVNFVGHTLADYAAVLVETGARHGIPVLNLHAAMPHGTGFDWRVHTSDGCHPNPAGHLRLADTIGAAIDKIKKENF